MSQHRTPEQAEAEQRVGKWNAVSWACWATVIGASVLWHRAPPHYWAQLVGVDRGTLDIGLSLLSLLWIIVAARCQNHAHDLRAAAQGKKQWSEQKAFEAEPARAAREDR